MRAFLVLLVVLSGCSSIRLGESLGSEAEGAPIGPLERAWERDAQGAFGPSAPYLTDEYVVVGTRRGEVVILNRLDGRVAGTGSFGESVEGALAVAPSGVAIYVPTAEHDGGVTAYDVRNGRQLWRWEGGATEAGVVRLGGVVVAATLDGRVVGLDAGSGTPRWEVQPDTTAQYHAAPLSIGTEAVLVADDRGRVTLYEAATGDARWTTNLGLPVYERPATDGSAAFVPTTRGRLVALDLDGGRVRWSHDAMGNETPRVSAPAAGQGAVAFGRTDGEVVVVDAATGAERWTHSLDANVSAAPLWMGDLLVVGTLDRHLLGFDAASGTVRWSEELRGRVKSALASADDILVVLTEPRHVVAFRPTGLVAR